MKSFETLPESAMSQQYCIDKCKEVTKTKPEYVYAAVQGGGSCSCGNMPPKEEKYGECRVPCNNALDEYCGGNDGQATWLMTGFGAESEFNNRVWKFQTETFYSQNFRTKMHLWL